MAYPLDPEWRMNITTEDIVYPFVDSTKNVFRKKTIELKAATGITTTVTVISEIKYQENGARAERILTAAEFTVEQFEEMKKWSDAEYKKQVRSYVNSNRKCVARVDDLEDCPSIAFYEKFAGDEDDDVEDDYRTVENAFRILGELNLTDNQYRRFLEKHYHGRTSYEIGSEEGVAHNNVLKSIAQVEKRLEKYFSENAQKQGTKTPKN